jgi:hypothetical protein
MGSAENAKRSRVEQECENSSVSSTEQAGVIILRTAEGPKGKSEFGVGDGVRTRDIRCHRPTLYQLSYAHQWLTTNSLRYFFHVQKRIDGVHEPLGFNGIKHQKVSDD